MPRSAARLGIVGFDSLPVHSEISVTDSTREPRVMHLTRGFFLWRLVVRPGLIG